MHSLNVSHLVVGLVLLGISGLWTADHAGWTDGNHYVLPVVLVAAGVIGLVAFALRGLFGRTDTTRNTDNQETTS
jgi:protein-S-isoprenylcysteine O-methyltransferase Ste14